jgi:GR25 family glycosyltransferase involved in LPS biosynthesis
MNNILLEHVKNYKFIDVSVINNTEPIKFNTIIKKIYVINLLEDLHKRNYIYTLFKKYGINYNIIIVDRIDKSVYEKLCKDKKISQSELGCCMSHMWCLLDILKNNYENAIIFEDDVVLSKNFIPEFLSIYEKTPKLDFLLLGAHDYNFSREHYKNVNDNLYKPNKNCRKLYGAHANYYSREGAQRMFYIRATNISFFDNEYNLIFDTIPDSYVCYPNLAISNITESSINHEKPILSKAEIGYYSLCFNNLNINDYNLMYFNLLDISMLKKDDTVDSFVERCLYYRLNDMDKTQLIKKRLALDVFTIEDIKQIIGNYNLIDPKSLSKKCIGEKS